MNISIIIVNYNNCDILKQCIDSIISLTSKVTYEVIIVDNNSTECDPKLVIPNDDRFTLLQNKHNVGFSKANNQALVVAKGKYILYLNNDTIFIENSLKKIYDYVEMLDKPSIIGCKLLNKDGSYQLSTGKFDTLLYSFSVSFFIYKLFPRSKTFNRYYSDYKNLKVPTEVDFVKGAFLFCSKNTADQLQGFDEKFFFYGEEVDFCYRFKKIGGNIVYYPLTKIIHLGGATTEDNLLFKYENEAKGRIQFYQKHLSGIQKYLAILFYYSGVFIRIPIYFLGGILTLKPSLIRKSLFYSYQLFIYPRNRF